MNILEEINKALEYTQKNKFKKAEEIYLKILKTDKKNNIILSFLGLLYLNSGSYHKAEKTLTKAYEINKSQTTLEGLALTKDYLNKIPEAMKYYSQVIDTTKNFEVFNRYIIILTEQRKHSKALDYAEKCVKLFPLKKEALSNLAECYIHKGNLKNAFDLSRKLIMSYPKFADGWLWYGLLQEMLFHDDVEAEKYFQQVVNCGEKYKGYYNLAVNAYKRGDYNKSVQYIKKYKKYEVIPSSSLFNMANIYMRQRKFKKGIEYYSEYIHLDRYKKTNSLITKLKNIWDGKTYKDETIFVYGDQGIGDLIMFSRYLPFLTKKFKTVKVLIRANLYSLFKRSFKKYKNIKFYIPDNMKRLPRYDKSGVLACLPYYLKADYNNIPFSEGYIEPAQNNIKKYEKIMNTNKLKVGICWEAGAAGWREQLNRTLNVTFYEPLFKIPNTKIYSLQVKPSLDNYKNYKEIVDLGSNFKDFDDTAGALKNLDVLVTVDTSLAHLAGAMGIKTFMLLPYCPDWRWFDDDKNTNWYKSIKIFKQQNPQSWGDVISEITKELTDLSKG